ncbi:zinc finger SWIM domain-containing protein 7-like [Oncorhynchus kisutch]|uniref:zinc finger SWIM domain-containing protein 7-like n=1 Tax=Oncorhynchus kisutch TaxID=8019 RepID=UPI0012DF8674|nr:zinc finger SWIM domain-containing protein 7-like [Oncorhynchus kisutch]
MDAFIFLPAVSEQIFKDIQKTEEKTLIADDLLIAIRFVFGSCALQALDLVDQRSVTCVSSSSGWTAYQVGSGTGRWCTCYTSCHYCPCPAFTYTVLKKNESLLCKHILMAYLSHAMGLSQQDSRTQSNRSLKQTQSLAEPSKTKLLKHILGKDV